MLDTHRKSESHRPHWQRLTNDSELAVRGRPSTIDAGRRDFERQLVEVIRDGLIPTSRVEVAKDGNVYNCGQTDGTLYFVESGQIKTVMLSSDGKECLLSLYTEGSVFGELCFGQAERVETATAMKTTVLRRISSQELLAALVECNLWQCFVVHLSQRLLEREQTITHLVTLDSEHRLAAVLLKLSRKLGKRSDRGLEIRERITQEDLSRMVGTTRSRIGYFLRRLRESGLVARSNGSFLTVDERKLSAYLEPEIADPWWSEALRRPARKTEPSRDRNRRLGG